jgi:hypothetical protein
MSLKHWAGKMPGTSKGVISMSGHDFVTFAPDCPSLPSDFPITGWQSKHTHLSQTHTFFFDSAGLLHMREATSASFDFVSYNACGTFLLSRPDISDALVRERWVSFQNGLLSEIYTTGGFNEVPGFRFSPTWEIAGARGDGLTQGYLDNNYDACVELIRDAMIDSTIKGGSRTSEIMLALALCASDRMAGITPDVAWSSLSQAQRTAASTWFIGMPQRKEDRTNA